MINLTWAIGVPLLDFYVTRKYQVHYEGRLPRKGPYVLLPKHQSLLDIPLEGMFVYQTERTCNFIMRPFIEPFNTLLKLCGGINVVRERDSLSTYEKDYKNRRAAAMGIKWLKEGQPLVIHQEGTRKYKAMRPIRIKTDSPLEKILEAQIPGNRFIPLGIEYEDVKKEGSHIWVRAGEPIYTSNKQVLREYLETEIPRLSGINSMDSS
jgi:1-acyl-sn-glycerol-3-phosphate acyltransferase